WVQSFNRTRNRRHSSTQEPTSNHDKIVSGIHPSRTLQLGSTIRCPTAPEYLSPRTSERFAVTNIAGRFADEGFSACARRTHPRNEATARGTPTVHARRR